MPAIWFAIMKANPHGPEPIIEADTQEVLQGIYTEFHNELQNKGFSDEKASIILEAFVKSFMTYIKSFKMKVRTL